MRSTKTWFSQFPLTMEMKFQVCLLFSVCALLKGLELSLPMSSVILTDAHFEQNPIVVLHVFHDLLIGVKSINCFILMAWSYNGSFCDQCISSEEILNIAQAEISEV